MIKNTQIKAWYKTFSLFVIAALVVGSFGAFGRASAATSADSPTTNAATSITTSDATLNATNGPSDASNYSFWVSTSPFNTDSPTIPSGVYSTPAYGAVASNTAFMAQLSAATGMPAVTPGTTYYFTAWSQVNGVWSSGSQLQFKTASSTDAKLSNLTISSGTLSPSFSSDVTSYTDSVDNSVDSVTLTPTVNDANATIKVNGQTVASGSASNPISLNVGSNTVLTVTTAQDGVTTNTYTITVTRAGSVNGPTTNAATNISSSDATLNAVNGSADATGHSFWVSTSPFSTASSNLPSGVYSTADFGAIASGTPFTALLSSVNGMPGVTASTTYYFAGWSYVNGTWYPGAVLNFTTSASTTATSTGGTIGGEVTGGQDQNGTLAVNSVETIKGTATADGTFANGWKYVFHITVPTNETKLAMKFSDWVNTTSASSTIPVANNMRISSQQADNGGATVLLTAANSYSSPDLNLTGDLDSGTPGRQVDVTVEVAVPSNSVNGSYTTNYGVRSLQ